MRVMIKKYKEVILYLIFGILTTVLNIAVFYIFDEVLSIHYLLANVAAWILSVLFAYETNRRFVFDSKHDSFMDQWKEFVTFIGYRLLSGGFDMIIMFIGVDCLHWSEMPVKILANIIVVISNYIFSKKFIFKK